MPTAEMAMTSAQRDTALLTAATLWGMTPSELSAASAKKIVTKPGSSGGRALSRRLRRQAQGQQEDDNDGAKHGDADQLAKRGGLAGFRRNRKTRADHLHHIMDCAADKDPGGAVVEAQRRRENCIDDHYNCAEHGEDEVTLRILVARQHRRNRHGSGRAADGDRGGGQQSQPPLAAQEPCGGGAKKESWQQQHK